MPLPKIPKTFFSSLGPLDVRWLSTKAATKALGKFSFVNRRIWIAKKMDPKAQWVTLWHEACHAALADSGQANHLTHEQTEALCDVIGNYLTAMMQSGQLVVNTQDTAVRKL